MVRKCGVCWPSPLILEGHPRREAAERSGMDRQTLRDWVHRYNDEGVAGLCSIRTGGHPASLTEAQMAELRELTINGPDPEKHKVVRWRCVDLREEVARRFTVTVTEGTIGKWLRKLGLTPAAAAALSSEERCSSPGGF